jgi:hypothetical protein
MPANPNFLLQTIFISRDSERQMKRSIEAAPSVNIKEALLRGGGTELVKFLPEREPFGCAQNAQRAHTQVRSGLLLFYLHY